MHEGEPRCTVLRRHAKSSVFELLISASGVGPSLALKILSGMSIEELVPAIRKSDLARTLKIPGVGRKTAERIVVELRELRRD